MNSLNNIKKMRLKVYRFKNVITIKETQITPKNNLQTIIAMLVQF